MKRPLPNTYWVKKGKLLAGGHPAFGQGHIHGENLQTLVDVGISYLLDLTEAWEVPEYPGIIENQTKSNLLHRRFPIRDFDIPTRKEMKAILDNLDEAIQACNTVYVHCFGGRGRTGTVVGCWLVRHGLTGEAAIRKIEGWREGLPGKSPETEKQRALVRGWKEEVGDLGIR